MLAGIATRRFTHWMGRSVERVARLLTKVFRVATVPSSTVPIYTATAGFSTFADYSWAAVAAVLLAH
jgi:hypothetical protein